MKPHSPGAKDFARTVRAAASFQHPGIVRIHDAQLESRPPYFIMEFIDGPSLDTLIEKEPLPARRTWKLLYQLANALWHAHCHSFVHQNINPKNIMIDSNGNAVLSAFGIASPRIKDPVQTTIDGFHWNRCRYMSPEQLDGKASEASDQYSLGLIAHELLTNRPPVAIRGWNDMAKKYSFIDAPPPLNDTCPDCPELEKIVMKMLRKSPADRWKTMEKVAAALANLRFQGAALDPRLETAEAVARVKESYRKYCLTKDFYESFYRTLFEKSDEAEELFAQTDLDRQYQHLREALLLMMTFPTQDQAEPTILTRIAERHSRLDLNVPPGLYGLFFDSLMETIESYDKEFDVQTDQSWRTVLAAGMQYMKNRY